MTKFIEIEQSLINIDIIDYVQIETMIDSETGEKKECAFFSLKNGRITITTDLNKYRELKKLYSLK